MILILLYIFGLTYVLSHEHHGNHGNHTTNDTDHDHSSHRHNNPNLPHCECITGILTSELDCTDQLIVDNIESYLISNVCGPKCGAMYNESNFDLNCNQMFAALIQYHDYCETLTVNEQLIHNYWDACSVDCLQDFKHIHGAPDCDSNIKCDEPHYIDHQIMMATTQCIPDTCMPVNSSSSINCTNQLRIIEGIHRMCSHDDITQNFDTKFDMHIDTWASNCDMECNPPDTIHVNCSLSRNLAITTLPGFKPLSVQELRQTENPTVLPSKAPTMVISPTNSAVSLKLFVSFLCVYLMVLFE